MTVELVGGGFDGLVQAAEEVRRGGSVAYVEPGLRAGGAWATESFLSPFRFNLGPALVRRPPLPSLHVLEPDVLLRVGDETVTRSGVPAALRDAFALLLGVDPASGHAAERLPEPADLVVVAGGNGLAAACLVDEIVGAGSCVVEGVGGAARGTVPGEGLGTCRLFAGVRGPAPVGDAFALGVGFDPASLPARLAALRAGDVREPLGFVLSNAHLDANLVEPELSSFVWQGVLPYGARTERGEYVERVLATLGVDPAAVVFRLLWLPEDTGERVA